VPGLEVARNGVVVPKGVWGLPLPVDPGEQRIEARAPGYLPQQQVVVVEKSGGTGRALIPLLVAAPVPAVAESAPMQTAPVQGMPAETRSPAPLASSSVDPGQHGLSTQQLVGIVVGGAGVALLAVGAGFGARANHKNGDAKDKGCRGKLCPDQAGVDLTDDAQTAAKISDVGFIGGGALLAGGLLTYFLAPRGEHQTKLAFSADQRSAACTVGGVF
jgi:hypothetical protein